MSLKNNCGMGIEEFTSPKPLYEFKNLEPRIIKRRIKIFLMSKEKLASYKFLLLSFVSSLLVCFDFIKWVY